MPGHERFHLEDVAALRAEIARLGMELPVEDDCRALGEPVRIGTRIASNRFAVQPMEGFDARRGGGPGELSFRRYRRYAAGGSALIWFEATAVLPEARSNPAQFYLRRGSVEDFRTLVEETRKTARDKAGHGVVLVLQLTHSGRYSKPAGIPCPIIAHRSAVLDPLHRLPSDYPLVTDEYLDRLQEVYAEAARLAAEAGFDGVDVKSCHRYLVSELLASHTREGRYGGSFENRSRFLVETVTRIREAAPDIFVTTRMNAYDAIPYPYGFGVSREDFRVPDLDEPLRLARRLRELGVPVLNVSIGNPYYNPHFGRPFDFPVEGGSVPAEHPLEAVARLAGIARRVQEAIPDVPVVASGFAWLRHLMPPVAAGMVRRRWATMIGQGRGAFAYPDSVRDILARGAMDPAKCCIACSACTQLMRDGGRAGCVVRDSAIYGPEYRRARRMSRDRLTAEAQRCRNCFQATCVAACPAHVDIPGFLSAFGEGDVRRAYGILRATNALPEMCARICPTEVQCEGSCVENIFCENPVPIGAIQLEIALAARRDGFAAVRLPDPPQPDRIAVVGAGPAGLACAIRLLERGYTVTIFEKDEQPGGVPAHVIPPDRIDDASAEIDAILGPALTAGRLAVAAGRELGRNLDLRDLRGKFDAVFLAVGLPGAARTDSGGPGVVDAIAFLRHAKAGRNAGVPPRVAVVGGGNTAADAALAALRLGARDVYLVYRRSFAEMPAWPGERAALIAAGVHVMILAEPAGFARDAGGQLRGLRIARTELGEPDASGRRRPIPVPASETVLRVELVVEATGQAVPESLRAAMEGVRFTRTGVVEIAPDSLATSLSGVFAGGDLIHGGSTAVQGVADGMRAADEIDAMLRKRRRSQAAREKDATAKMEAQP